MGTQLPSPTGAQSPIFRSISIVGTATQFSAHVYCGQTAVCIRMPLGMEVGLVHGHIVIVALWNRADHYIFMLWFVLQIGCLPYFHTWCGLSANLRCSSETCCTWLAESTARKKSRQKSPSGHHRTTLSGCIFATEAHIDNQKKTC